MRRIDALNSRDGRIGPDPATATFRFWPERSCLAWLSGRELCACAWARRRPDADRPVTTGKTGKFLATPNCRAEKTFSAPLAKRPRARRKPITGDQDPYQDANSHLSGREQERGSENGRPRKRKRGAPLCELCMRRASGSNSKGLSFFRSSAKKIPPARRLGRRSWLRPRRRNRRRLLGQLADIVSDSGDVGFEVNEFAVNDLVCFFLI